MGMLTRTLSSKKRNIGVVERLLDTGFRFSGHTCSLWQSILSPNGATTMAGIHGMP